MKKISCLFLIFLFYSFNSQAVGLGNVVIEGNERVDQSIIVSYLDLKGISAHSPAAINESLKNLYESNLFLEVSIFSRKEKMVVRVVENPIVSEIKFVGNDKVEATILGSEITLKKRAVFTKSKLQADLKRINEIYLKSGRFLSRIEPKIIPEEGNRVQIIFDIYEGKKAAIGQIAFVGNKAFSQADLISEISTAESKWYKFLSSSDSYDSDRVEFDKERLRRFYTSKGYADFTVVSSSSQISPTKDKFFITFLIEEGIKYKFGEIKIDNKIEKLPTSLLEKSILIKSKKTYNSELIEKTIDKMVEVLSNNSYAFADVEPVLKPDREKQIMDVDFVISETPRIYINQITIKGNVRTKDEVIRRELRVKEGDPYNITKINRSRQRIQNLGFFESVDFKTNRIGNTDKVNIDIQVKEKKTGELNVGVGYSTVDMLSANVGIKERNIFGTGDEVGLNLQKSSYSLSSAINYNHPYFLGNPFDTGFDVFKYSYSKRNTLAYSQDSQGFTLKGGYSISEFLSHQVRYSLRTDKVSDVDPAASYNIQNLAGTYNISALGQTFLYDKRDNRFDPRNGYFASISQDYSGLGGDICNIKHEGAAGYYQPIVTNDYILKFLVRGGIIKGIGQGVRSNYGFFLGGNTFRGFQYAGVGPRTMNNGDAKGGDIVGGNMYYVGTTEFRFPLGLPKEIGISGILFVDAGTATKVDKMNTSQSPVADSGSIRATTGIGIAWASPMGPIRFNFSHILKREPYDIPESFQFSFGSDF